MQWTIVICMNLYKNGQRCKAKIEHIPIELQDTSKFRIMFLLKQSNEIQKRHLSIYFSECSSH